MADDNRLKDKKVAILGPAGTFSQEAALKFFPLENLSMESTIGEIFESVKNEESDLGLVPAENTTKGPVFETVDLLLKSPLKIKGSLSIKIRHCLLGVTDDLSKIEVVKSHPQALAQCKEWINQNIPGANLSPQPSTVSAIKENKKEETAFIASSAAAREYEVEVLKEDIQDRNENETEFYLISKKRNQKLGKILNPKKTLIVTATKDKPGVLHKILGCFAKNNLNLTKLYSRPTGKGKANYYFFIEIEGLPENEKVKKALKEIKGHSTFFKILGRT